MTSHIASQVITREGTATNAPPPAIATATTGIVGVTQKGPLGAGEAVLTTSMSEWRATFGDPTALSLAAFAAADGFYAEGGRFLWTSRVVHLDLQGDPATAAKSTIDLNTSASGPTLGFSEGTEASTWSVTSGTTINVDMDAGGPGGDATFTHAKAAPVSTINGNGLADLDTIEIALGPGLFDDVKQIVTFNTADFGAIATPTDVELAGVINAALTGGSALPSGGGFVIVRDDVSGTASRVRIQNGQAALFGWPVDTAGTGNVANGAALSELEFTTLVGAVTAATVTVDGTSGLPRVTSSGAPGAGSSVQLGGTALAAFGFDAALHSGAAGAPVPTLTIEGRWEGAYGDDITAEVTPASSGLPEDFNLIVRYLGGRVESFANLTMDDTDPRWVVSVLADDPGVGSSYIAAIDLVAGLGTPLLDRPADGVYVLAGGDDGLTGLVDSDYIGTAGNKKAIYSFDYVKELRILCIPGRATPVVQNAAIVYAETVRSGSIQFIVDPPEGMTASEIVTYVRDTATLFGISEFAISYWPRVRIVNPDPLTFGTVDNLVVAPSGHIAGVYARNDAAEAGGVYKPAGGFKYGPLTSIVGLETIEVEDPVKRDLVAPALVNPISTQSGRRALDGVDTLRSNSNFPTIGERRGATFIKLSIAALLEEYRLRNNDATLRAEVNRRVSQFLNAQFKNGAFRGATPAESYYVNTDDTLNNDAIVSAGRLLVEVGIATQKPAKFIELTISQDLRAQAIAAAAV